MSKISKAHQSSTGEISVDITPLPLSNGHVTPVKRKRSFGDSLIRENGSTEYIKFKRIDDIDFDSKHKSEDTECITPSKDCSYINGKILATNSDQTLAFSPADSELSNCSCESDKFIVYKPEDSYLYMNLSAEARDQAEWGDCILTTNRRRTRSNSVCDTSGKDGKPSGKDGKGSGKDAKSAKNGKTSGKGGKVSGKDTKGKERSRSSSTSYSLNATDSPSGRVSPGYLQACLLNATSEELPVNLDKSLPRRETRSLSVK